MVVGPDLVNKAHQDEVTVYIAEFGPLVIVMGSQLASFGHWSHLNRYVNPNAWSKFRKVGECLAEFAARVCVCTTQSGAGRHLLAGNPAGSELFHLSCPEAIWNTGEVAKVDVSKCALGLVVHGQPVYKNTASLASSALFF